MEFTECDFSKQISRNEEKLKIMMRKYLKVVTFIL